MSTASLARVSFTRPGATAQPKTAICCGPFFLDTKANFPILAPPKFEREKDYLVAIDVSLNPKDKQKLEKGIKLSDGKTYHARVRVVRKMPPFNHSITIHEGRNRQVRRMFEELGHKVLVLRRVRIDKLRLGNLKDGEARGLNRNEIAHPLSST